MNTPSFYDPGFYEGFGSGPGSYLGESPVTELRSTFQSIFGVYSPSGDGFGGADWEYIFSVIIVIMILYFILSIIRGFFKR